MERTGRYAFNEIVVEPLTNEHGKAWFECVKSYLMAQNMWEVIDGTFKRPHEDDKDHNENYVRWKRMNAAALHAIQISCTPESFTHIREVSEAKEAWRILNDTYNSQPSTQSQLPPQVTEEPVDFIEGDLYKAICENKWSDACVFIRQHPSALGEKITKEGETALHLAVALGHVDLVKKLLAEVPREYLEICDDFGSTPLSTAVTLFGEDMTEVVECVVNKNPITLGIPNKYGALPVTLAFKNGKKEMGRYLYSETPLECLKPEKESQGPQLLYWCFVGGYLDVALDLLQRCKELLLAKTTCEQATWAAPIITIASMPPAFANIENKPVFWKRWIYKLLDKNKQTTTGANSVRVYIQQQDQIRRVPATSAPGLMQKITSPIYNILGMNKVHEMKLAKEILRLVGKNVNVFSTDQQAIVAQALFRAAREGFSVFVKEIIKANSSAVLFSDESRKHLFFHAIRYRQDKVFNLIYKTRFMEALAARIDENGNTMLHVAGYPTPPSQLRRSPIPALQMQSELQWFKEVQSVVSPGLKALQNNEGKTAEELFKENHKELLKEGQKWMKDTASSLIIVGTLVVTIMFPAAFTLPGGNNQDFGNTIFLSKEVLFLIYFISDALSLFSSATSVLTCLGILNSRYAEEDFLEFLPRNLIIGVDALFFSIATMMIAFSAAILPTVQHRYSWSYIAISIFSIFPVSVFAFLQVPLLMEMFFATYGKCFIKKKRNQKPKP